MHTASVVLSGTVVQFNLSPKGAPEGFILRGPGGGLVQVNFEPHLAGAVTSAVKEGEAAAVMAVEFAERHPDAGPVFEMVKLDTSDGKTVVAAGPEAESVEVSGKVVRLNHARRGEINGAILESGDFVHLRPHGVRALGGLKIGQRLDAAGEVRGGWSNHRVIEAATANGIEIGKPDKPHHPKKAPQPKGPKRGPLHKHGHCRHGGDEITDSLRAVVSK